MRLIAVWTLRRLRCALALYALPLRLAAGLAVPLLRACTAVTLEGSSKTKSTLCVLLDAPLLHAYAAATLCCGLEPLCCGLGTLCCGLGTLCCGLESGGMLLLM